MSMTTLNGDVWTARTLGALLALILAAPVAAQEFTWDGSIWSRFETRQIDGGANAAFTLMQTRIAASGVFSPRVRFFAQAQDVRRWGEESSTTDASADQFDFHQAYMELGDAESPLRARLGRQEYEVAFGRLVGTPVWSPTSRAYDGAVVTAPLSDDARLELFGFQIAEASSTVNADDEYLAGAWAQFDLGDDRTLHLFGVHDRDNADAETSRTTLGTEYVATTGPVFYRVEAALQAGTVSELDISAANLIAVFARVPFAASRGTFGIGYDRYSGDASPGPGESAGFSDLFGRNHRFLGFADLFNDPRANTGGRGLANLNLRGTWTVRDDLVLRVDWHRFDLVDDAGLDGGRLGDEIDVQLMGPLFEQLRVRAGGSWVGAEDPLVALGRTAGDQLFAYLQLSAGF